MRRLLVLGALVVGALAGSPTPAPAVIHVTVPADDCAPSQAQAVSNDQFEAQVSSLAGQGKVTLPLGGFKNAPTSCPAD